MRSEEHDCTTFSGDMDAGGTEVEEEREEIVHSISLSGGSTFK